MVIDVHDYGEINKLSVASAYKKTCYDKKLLNMLPITNAFTIVGRHPSSQRKGGWMNQRDAFAGQLKRNRNRNKPKKIESTA